MGTEPPAARLSDPEAEYYQAIEEFFVSRRGDPLILSNSDWVLIREWRTSGIPLRIVLRGIADALDGHAHSLSRSQKVGSLRYCATEVQAARERWERALSTPGEPGVGAALLGFSEALRGAQGLRGEAAGYAMRFAQELEARAGEPGDLKDVEPWLKEREEGLLAALEMDPQEEARLTEDLEKALARYKGRLPPWVLEQVRRDGRARRLLEAHNLPRMSLFQL